MEHRNLLSAHRGLLTSLTSLPSHSFARASSSTRAQAAAAPPPDSCRLEVTCLLPSTPGVPVQVCAKHCRAHLASTKGWFPFMAWRVCCMHCAMNGTVICSFMPCGIGVCTWAVCPCIATGVIITGKLACYGPRTPVQISISLHDPQVIFLMKFVHNIIYAVNILVASLRKPARAAAAPAAASAGGPAAAGGQHVGSSGPPQPGPAPAAILQPGTQGAGAAAHHAPMLPVIVIKVGPVRLRDSNMQAAVCGTLVLQTCLKSAGHLRFVEPWLSLPM